MKLLNGYVICDSVTTKSSGKEDAEQVAQRAIERAMNDASCLDWENPEWASGGKVHNWHNYASEALQLIWKTFTPEQKKIIASTLDECASNEYWD